MPNFTPNVTYNVPVVQPVQWKEVEKPDINIKPIDIGGIVSGISSKYVKEEEDKAKKEYQAGLNKYALELDRIVEGQRQGRYNQYQADRLMREATDNMIGLGWNAVDVAPVRDKFSGKVPELEQRRQTMMMEHQQEFEEKQIETFRTENPFYANESDATVKNIVGTLDNLERNVKFYNDLALQGKTDEEIASYANQRIKSGEDLVAFNTFMDLHTMLGSQEALANMNQQQYDAMTHNLKLALRVKYKYDQGMADVIVDRAMNSIGADQVIKDVKDTYRNNTEWNKMAVENVDSSAQYAVRKIPAYPLYNALNPETRQAIAMQKPTFINDLYSEMEKTIENPEYAKASIKTLGANTVQDAGWTTQIYTSLVGDRLKPTSYLAGLAVTGTKQAVNVLKNPFETTNEADRKTNLANARKILNAYKDKDLDDMRRQAAMRGDTSTIAALDAAEQNLGYAKAVVTVNDQIEATPELRNLAASLQNQGTSRFRIDPETGKLLMTRKTTGTMQTLGDLMASAETRQQVNKVNDLLESSTPAERKAYVTMMFNNDIADYNGEELWDTSKRSLKEMFADAANNLASATTSLATFRSDPEAMKAIEDNDEKALGLLRERKIGVLGDRLFQKLRESDEIPLERSAFTGEETTQTSKVSNTSTIGGASLVPQENMSARALRQYADRLEASVASVERTGAKTEKGKLENDRKLIEAARAKADELEGVTTITSKVSSKSTIGGASIVNDDREMAIAPEADDLVVVDENSTRFKDEENRKDFNRWFADKLEKGEISPEDKGVDYDYVGFFNDPETDKTATSETHFTDKYKKPNHDTFSDESIYATGENKKYAGRWEGDDYVPTKEGMYRLVEKIGKIKLEMEELSASSKERKNLAEYVKELEEYVDNYVKYSARERIHAAAVANGRPQ